MKIFGIIIMLFVYFFVHSSAYSGDFFPYKNIIYADSCENPVNIVMWKDAEDRNNLLKYQLKPSEDKLIYFRSWAGANIYSDGMVHIVYNDIGDVPGRNLIDKQYFYNDGYRVKERWYYGEYQIKDFTITANNQSAPKIYKCNAGSLAFTQMTKKMESIDQSKRIEANKKSEEDRISMLKFDRQIQDRNNFMRMMCKGRPRIQRNILEQLSRQIKVAPDSIYVNRIEYVRNTALVNLGDGCKATFYSSKGACSAYVELDESGAIKELNEECQ